MIDRDHIVRAMGGDEALAEKFLEAFKAEVKKQLPLLKIYLEEGNRDLLSNGAHVMKTQLAYAGLGELRSLAQHIEEQAMTTADLSDLVKDVSTLEEKLLQIIHAELP